MCSWCAPKYRKSELRMHHRSEHASQTSHTNLTIGRRSREKSQNRYEGLQKVGEQTPEVMSKFSLFVFLCIQLNGNSIRKSGKVQFSNMTLTNLSQHYNTQTLVYNRVSATCRIMVMSLMRYNIISVMQSKYNMARIL